MGIFDQTPVTTSSGSSVLPITPDWKNQANMSIIGQGAQIAGQEPTQYTGPRNAAFTPDQNISQQFVRNLASGTQADPNALQSNINYGLSQFDPNEVNKYMSPYTSGVINEIGRLGNKNLFENVLPGVNSTFTGAGQFGSTRNADFTNRAMDASNYTILGQQANALQSATNNAMQAYQGWHNQAIPAASQATSLGTGTTANLGASGALQQAQDQGNLNVAYSDFQQQQNAPKDNLSWFSNLANGQATPSASTTTNSALSYQPSAIQQAIGVYGLMSGAGIGSGLPKTS